MDYNELIADKTTAGSIKSWCNYDLIPVASAVKAAQDFIYKTLLVREMLVLATGTLAQGDSTVALPARYISPEYFGTYGDNTREVPYLDQQHFEQRIGFADAAGNLNEGTPTSYTVDAGTILFDVKMDQAYLYRFWHYARPADLTGGAPTNFLTDRHTDLLLAACLIYGFDQMKDYESSNRQMERAVGLIQAANRAYDIERDDMRKENYWRQIP